MNIKVNPLKMYAAIVISLISIVGMVTGVVAGIRRVGGMDVRFNKRDLPKHGLHIITSADPNFETVASHYFKNQSSASNEDLKPFSVFIQNSGDRMVVAYRLVWQLVRADGQVLTNTNSYSEPGILMGDQMPTDPRFKHTITIEPNEVRCFSWSAPIIPAGNARLGSSSALQSVQLEGMQDADALAIRNQLTNELAQATNVTVSLDGAFFDDGTFVGPNVTGYFERIQAIVRAKVDLLSDVARATELGKTDEVFEAIAAKGAAPDVTITDASPPEDYYKQYVKLFAAEITGMKTAYGKERLIAHLLNSSNRARTLLRK